jgi:hypothetical protein
VEPYATAIWLTSGESLLAGAYPGDLVFAVGMSVRLGPLPIGAAPVATAATSAAQATAGTVTTAVRILRLMHLSSPFRALARIAAPVGATLREARRGMGYAVVRPWFRCRYTRRPA